MVTNMENFNLIEGYVDENNVSGRSPCPQRLKPTKRSNPIFIDPALHSEDPALHSERPPPELVDRCRKWETQVFHGSIDYPHTTNVLYSAVCLKHGYDKSDDLSQDKRGKCASCAYVFFSRVGVGCDFCSADCRVSFTQRLVDQQAD